MKPGRAALLSLILLVLGASPASAAPVLAAKPWHYWLAPVLFLSFLGVGVLLVLGYLVKVVSLKYGIRVGKRSTG